MPSESPRRVWRGVQLAAPSRGGCRGTAASNPNRARRTTGRGVGGGSRRGEGRWGNSHAAVWWEGRERGSPCHHTDARAEGGGCALAQPPGAGVAPACVGDDDGRRAHHRRPPEEVPLPPPCAASSARAHKRTPAPTVIVAWERRRNYFLCPHPGCLGACALRPPTRVGERSTRARGTAGLNGPRGR